MSNDDRCGATPSVDDHIRQAVDLMRRGASIHLYDIPNDPSFLSSHFGSEVSIEIAGRLSAALQSAGENPAPEAHVMVPQSALDWLFGEGPDVNGDWFEKPDDAPAFWWRSRFRNLIGASGDAQQAPARQDVGNDHHRYAVVSTDYAHPFLLGAYATLDKAERAQGGKPDKWEIFVKLGAPSPQPRERGIPLLSPSKEE